MASTTSSALDAYNAKRNFARTPEPAGKAARSRGSRFIVQKHAATRLHYDFRLELDGVLKSWAVTKGPSLDPSDKRLAVRTEDHPLSYAGFEGSIPAGEYGGGTVIMWDDGAWEPVGDPHAGLERGKLHFRLKGKRMRGEWVLVRLKNDKGSRENWLLRKIEDDFARTDLDITAEHTTSIKSDLMLADVAGGKTRSPRPRRTGKLAPPAFRPVQLATLADAPPSGRGWLHEMKFDGYRCLLVKSGDEVATFTRNGNDWSDRFDDVVQAGRALGVTSATLDGEVVVMDDKGLPSFACLQKALSEGVGELMFFAFDLLELDGADLTHLPLLERKAKLKPLVEAVGVPFLFSDHVAGDGEQVLSTLCRQGAEGIVSKRADAKYTPKRSTSWLKVKCTKRQEFVIAGWTESSRGRDFASLIIGTYEDGRLRYAGRVGTGFDSRTMADLSSRMAKLARAAPAFDDVPAAARRGARWVEPKLVAEIAFAEVTADGVLRHPSFVALREDKPAREVSLDRAIDVDLMRAGVAITNPDRVIYPEIGVTKRQLIEYYESIADVMLPHVMNRPLSLVRCPQGRGKQCFFQRHDSGIFPAGVHRIDIEEADGKREPHVYIENLQGLVALLQMGTLEIHIWGSRIGQLEFPDRLVIDLDPDEGLGFAAVRTAAFDVRDRLADVGLKSFPMLSGGKGIHVVAPLAPEKDWDAVKAFTHEFAEQMAADEPDRFTANMSKARRKGRIFIDWLRNQRGATAIAPYSSRARPGAPVAYPVNWSRLRTIEGPEVTVSTAKGLRRLKPLLPAGLAQTF